MKSTPVIIAAFSAVTLSACFSSSNVEVPVTADPVHSTEKQKTPPPPPPPSEKAEKNLVQAKKGAAPEREAAQQSEKGSWAVINVNGEEERLIGDRGNRPSTAGAISYQYFPLQGHKAIYHLTDGNETMLYGHHFSSQDPNDISYFAVGDLTPKAAQEKVMHGKAIYNGNAFLQNETTKVLANFKAKVDFDGKKVAGSFSNLRPYQFTRAPAKLDTFKKTVSVQDFAGKAELGFTATIDGNKFEGDGAVGNFYGKEAQSIGGVLKQEKVEGAFGGSR